MKRKTYLLICVGLLLGITLNSCKKKEGCTDEKATNFNDKAKKEDGSCKYDLQSVDDHNEAQKEFDDVFSTSELAMKDFDNDMGKGANQVLSDTTCAILSIDTSYSVNGAKGRITIDFGSTNCVGVDGRNRRGKIFVDYTGKYRTIGTKITTTFDNYYVNDVKVEGSKVVETETREIYNVTVTGGKLTFTDNTIITWQSDATRTWTEGNSTDFADIWNIWNDVHVLNGTASGVGRFGQSFDVDIDNITLKLACWLEGVFAPVEGKIKVKPENFDDIVLDYGDGACDKKGTVTVGSGEPVEYDWSN